jgi:[glutamine synthetase] adenylyltransferase / [glutamine synthetase]-adenylyl-L-tyrosine phosphorylase
VISRLPDRYGLRFDAEAQAHHAEMLSKVDDQNPVQCFFSDASDGRVTVTVVTFNYDYVFSLITGVLSSHGFNVLSGEAFTEKVAEHVPVNRFRTFHGDDSGYARGVYRAPRAVARRKIVDVFTGKIADPLSIRLWKQQVLSFMDVLFALLSESKSEDAIALVNRSIVQRLAQMPQREKQLSPAMITLDNDLPTVTRLTVVTQDTPMFLYAISQSLAMQGLSIDYLTIRTEGSRIEDVFEIVDAVGQKIDNPDLLDQIRLSTLLTKQFTYSLDKAPNPYDALSRFGSLLKSIADVPEKSQWLHFFSDSRALADIARLLGTSDSLWEDVIRVHLETLLPVLTARMSDHPVYAEESSIGRRLRDAVAKATDKKQALNRFKDQEMFLLDLNHILGRSDLTVLSRQLTTLVQEVLKVSVALVWETLVARYGVPMAFGDVPTKWALMGLGKLGGAALGYASDIELMLVYGDSGQTQGPEIIGNDAFFGLLVQGLTQSIDGKRDGIFEIDLRLRPYGKDGPLGVPLAQFCQYFGFDGPSHSYERLALVRMRSVAGDLSFGKKIERLRNQYLYDCHFPCDVLWELRKKQYQEKVQMGRVNLKYSPGALVDLEYAVQMLQVLHGKDHARLKTPYIRESLAALENIGVMRDDQAELLRRAYLFFRQVINGLRMLRGSAHDLELPDVGSSEFDFLAKRIGYHQTTDMSPSKQLFSEIQTYMAAVRTFVDDYFSRDALPDQIANIADLVFSDQVPEVLRDGVLSQLGFKNLKRSYDNLRRLASCAKNKALFAQLAVLAAGYLSSKSDPDMALNNWERLVSKLDDPDAHFALLMRQPSRLDIMMDLFSVSQFLSDSVINDPELLQWASEPHRLKRRRKRGELTADLAILSQAQPDDQKWLSVLRRFRRRELLRIAIKDVSLQVSLQDVVRDISMLAEALSQATLARVWQRLDLHESYRGLQDAFCLLAMGKLGATELNYSSDIDLVPLYDDALVVEMGISESEARAVFSQVLTAFQAALTSYTSEGRVYRMDFNLRPYGSAGEWVTSITQLFSYYETAASLWEVQALLKMRPLAGSWVVGFSFLYGMAPIFQKRIHPEKICQSINRMRDASLKQLHRRSPGKRDVKNGDGGIRDIEFLVQGIQLMALATYPKVLCRSTLQALNRIQGLGLLPVTVCQFLRDHYLLFRRLEHFLQIFEDQQVHAVPNNLLEQQVLARRLFGDGADVETLHKTVEEGMRCISQMRRQYLVPDLLT